MRTYADRATLALRNVEVLTVQLSALCLGAEGDSTSALTEPARVHAVHLSFRKLLPIMDALRRDWGEEQKEKQTDAVILKLSTMWGC